MTDYDWIIFIKILIFFSQIFVRYFHKLLMNLSIREWNKKKIMKEIYLVFKKQEKRESSRPKLMLSLMLLFNDHNWSWIFYIFLCLLLQRHKLRNSIILVSLIIQHMIYDNHNNNGGWRRDIDNTVNVITSNAFNFEYFKVKNLTNYCVQ